MNLRSLLFAMSLLIPLATATAARPAAESTKVVGYHTLRKIAIGGEANWDYLTVDAEDRLLYVTHGDQVEVVNVDRGAKEDPIVGLSGTHGVVLVPSANRGFITNGRTNTLVVFDRRTHQKVGEIKTGTNPDAILYDSSTNRIFTFNGKSMDATAVDMGTQKVAGTVALGGKPERAVSDGQGTLFVNVESTDEIVAFDARGLKILHRWKLSPGQEPTGLALDEKNHRLFSVCSNKLLVVMNSDTGAVVTTVPIGAGSDGVKFDPGTGLIFSSNGDGTLTVIHEDAPDQYHVEETVPTARGARTLDVDLTTHHVFVSTYGTGAFIVLELGQ